MAFRFGYFDSDIIGIDDEGMPIFDRAETSELFAILLDNLFSDGVLEQPSTCFQVLSANNGLNIEIQPGFAMIRGHFCYSDEIQTLTVETAPQVYNRIDRVVLRCNYQMRVLEIIMKTGKEAANPLPPDLIRPAVGDYYELCLANIYLTAGQRLLTQSSITDMRPNPSVCGYLTGMGTHYAAGEPSELGYWKYDEANEELVYANSTSNSGGVYTPETETIIFSGSIGNVNATAIAEQAAAIVQGSFKEITTKEVEQAFNVS